MNEEGDFTLKGMINFILVAPALLSVIGFIVGIIFGVNAFKNLNDIWTTFGSGGMSALPIYFGLSALASAYLIKPEIIITDYSSKVVKEEIAMSQSKNTAKIYKNHIALIESTLQLHHLLGYIYLIPVVIGTVGFGIGLFSDINIFKNLNDCWSGYVTGTSSLPIYLGLMSIAGVFLIKTKEVV